VARGEKSGARRHPECTPRGDAHYARRHPEWSARGSRQGNAKLTEADIPAIRSSIGTEREIAAKYGVCPQTVGNIRRRETWKHVF
jgi:hypothetical protein